MAPPQPVVEFITDALCGLARANWYEFAKDPALCRAFNENYLGGKHRYFSDKSTCGLADCWSSYKILVERYQRPHFRFCRCSAPICQNKRRLVAKHPGIILLDCEDAACALAGWLSAQCFTKDRILVGLVPGETISHAIMGAQRPDGSVTISDPALRAGMRTTEYKARICWRDVATERAPAVPVTALYHNKQLIIPHGSAPPPIS